MDKRFFYFVNEVLFKGWKNAASIPGMLGIISFILVPKMDSKWPFKYSLLIGIGLVIFSLVTKILIQMYSLFMEKDLMAKAIRIVKGEGLYAGKSIVIFQNKINVNTNEIVTMYCSGTGSEQPICLLRVLDKNNNEIITDVYPSGETCKINKYFEEDSRKNRTYIKRSIDYRLLEKSILKQE